MRLRLLIMMNLGLSYAAHGATVLKFSKKLRSVIIDEGSDSGIAKKDKICFYHNNKARGCGRVTKVKSNKAYVKVGKKTIRRIKKGMEARPKGGSGGGVAGGQGTNIKLAYILGMMSPAVYQNLSYKTPEGAAATTLWEQSEKSQFAPLGFGLELGLDMFGQMAVGFRSSTYTPFKAESDYDTTGRFAETVTSASSVGLWFDYYFMSMEMMGLNVNIGAGLDIDNSSVTFESNQKTDDGSENNPLATATSKAMVISIRIPIAISLPLGPIALGASPIFFLPASASASFSGEVTDANAASLDGTTGEADLETALGHTKNGFGLQMMFSAAYAF